MKYFFVLLLSFSSTLAQDVQEGAPAFLPTVLDSYGRTVDLAGLSASGKWVALWFYPRAFTSGCSLQAKRYSDLNEALAEAGVQAFGISADSAETQCDFVEDLAENGHMLPDGERVLADAFGVKGGSFFSRDTVLINPEGSIEKIWRRVQPIDDADRVLEYVLAKTAD